MEPVTGWEVEVSDCVQHVIRARLAASDAEKGRVREVWKRRIREVPESRTGLGGALISKSLKFEVLQPSLGTARAQLHLADNERLVNEGIHPIQSICAQFDTQLRSD